MLNTNPLDEYPGIRKRVYAAFWMLGALLGALQVSFASMDQGTPDLLKAALAAYAFLGGLVGFTASSNTPENGEELADDELEDLPENDDDLL